MSGRLIDCTSTAPTPHYAAERALKVVIGAAGNTKRYRGYCRPHSFEAPPEAHTDYESSTPCIFVDTRGRRFTSTFLCVEIWWISNETSCRKTTYQILSIVKCYHRTITLLMSRSFLIFSDLFHTLQNQDATYPLFLLSFCVKVI